MESTKGNFAKAIDGAIKANANKSVFSGIPPGFGKTLLKRQSFGNRNHYNREINSRDASEDPARTFPRELKDSIEKI